MKNDFDMRNKITDEEFQLFQRYPGYHPDLSRKDDVQ